MSTLFLRASFLSLYYFVLFLRYFPLAEIHAFDVAWYGAGNKISVEDNLNKLKPRVHPHIINILEVEDLTSLGFLPESMDVIIEDGVRIVLY